jgi:hypothetical protein
VAVSGADLPKEIGRGTMQLGPIEIEVVNLDNGQRLISPDGLAAFFHWLETGEAQGPLKNVTPGSPK